MLGILHYCNVVYNKRTKTVIFTLKYCGCKLSHYDKPKAPLRYTT